MVSKALSLAKLLGDNNKLSTDTFGDDVSTIEQASSTDVLTNLGNAVGDQRLVGSNLYIWNGTGWYRIALINQTPTWDSGGQPSASYILDADSPQDATVITLAASDPDGLPISYSYVTSGSMDSMAIIGQDSSVFTITPKTVAQVGEGVSLTGSITFRASDGVNILPSVSSFTLNFITIIENSRYTTLLATAVDTSDNNDITDSSTNNYTITVNGDAHAGTFSPYRHGGYSTYFDGSGDWLELTGTALGNGDFTVEAWVWLDSLKDYNLIYDDRATGSSATGLALGVMSTGAPYLYTNNGFQITSSQTCTAKTWHHISLVRSSGVITIYLDGTSGGSYSSSANFTDTNLGIGVARTYTVTSQFGGYISDVRAVVGSAITPPSGGPIGRLEAVTNTSLLTCHLPYIADGSTNSHSITVSGNVSTKPFSPYDYLEYSATDHGGSIYFDGNGDVIYTSQDTAFNFGTTDFTFEAWVYPTLYTSNNWNTLFSIGNSTNFGGLLIGKTDTGSFVIRQYGTANIVSTTTLPDLNTWTHIACVRSSGTSKLYYNGSEIATASDTTNYSSTTPFAHIGNSDHTSYSHYWNGYVSDARFISGTAVYSGAFTPPIGPLTTTGGTYPSTTNVDTNITASNTKLLTKGTDASIIDKSQTYNLQLVGNTTGSTTQVKFADTKSMYFDGDADEIAYTVPTLSGDFTFEAFIYPESQIQTFPNCFIPVWDTTSGNRIVLLYDSSSYVDKFSCRVGSNFIVPSSTSSTGQWYHVAVVRSGSAVSMYIDGIQIGTQTYSGSISSRTGYIGGNISNGTNGAFKGYIQDFRVTNGLARYTANFTPPTAPLEG